MTEDDLVRMYTDLGYVLHRRCLAYLGEPSAAQDAVQEIFVRAMAGASAFRGDCSSRTWLCRIADHLCIDLVRRRRRNPVGLLEHGRALEGMDAAVQALPSGQEAAVTVRQLFEGLGPDAKRLAVLYYLDELTQEEIASELGLSRRTVGKRLKALLARSKALMGATAKA
jgi:RNA polymerase sigma factor (sigma-70 family)